MKILIVEDQPEKAQDIINYLSLIPSVNVDNIIIEESLRSGLMRVVSGDTPDLVILDMSMPRFTSGANSKLGSEPVSFAGRELMKQLKIREIYIPTIVVTQYAVFEKDNVTLKDLDLEFKAEFNEFYIGSVYYSSASSDWKTELNKLIGDILI